MKVVPALVTVVVTNVGPKNVDCVFDEVYVVDVVCVLELIGRFNLVLKLDSGGDWAFPTPA